MMIAHLLPNNVIPDAVQWVAVGLMTAGGLGILRRRRHTLDVLSWTTFAVGALACFGMVGVAMFTSPQPGYRISLAVGTDVTSPVSVTVCAQQQSGLATTTPDGTNVLAVLIDGVQVGVESTHTFLMTVAPGTHDLRVELVTRDHREFSPVVAADASIRVSGLGAPASWMPCPNQ